MQHSDSDAQQTTTTNTTTGAPPSGMEKIKLQKYATFNHELHEAYPRPGMEKRSVKGGTCILVDTSYSMKARKRELLSVVQGLRKMAGKSESDMPLPDPSGGTALADVAHKFASKLSKAKFLIVSDGDDTSSKTQFTYPRPKNYRRTWRTYEKGGVTYFIPSKQWICNKRTKVLEHLEETLKAHIVLVGMGDGAKQLIRAASRKGRRINVAYIEDGETVEDIGKVLNCAVEQAQRKNDGSKARIITAKGLNGEKDDDFWDEEDEMEGFIAGDEDEEEPDNEDEDEEEPDDDDEEESDQDSVDLCDDDSDDDAPPTPNQGGKKRAALTPVSNRTECRTKRAKAAKSYKEDSDDEDDDDWD